MESVCSFFAPFLRYHLTAPQRPRAVEYVPAGLLGYSSAL